ncbi:uncharacterized protein LOC129760216 isoform X2 [Uranotaenia lowii]|uniref:uncharacterized protein LOC129760216 isoform X2 n=1 Tax=Uranotaenia lowii TaxID=190385 RepID=UPI00247B14F0|nr:uncharacterized protein LOC129760216 isoform X2 [Uranotaenia lowii]
MMNGIGVKMICSYRAKHRRRWHLGVIIAAIVTLDLLQMTLIVADPLPDLPGTIKSGSQVVTNVTVNNSSAVGDEVTIMTTMSPVKSNSSKLSIKEDSNSHRKSNKGDNEGTGTVVVQMKHFGMKNYSFLEPAHSAIRDFRDLDENVDLELLFREEVLGPDGYGDASGGLFGNIVLQIEDYDDEGNPASYFLHSTPHSENNVLGDSEEGNDDDDSTGTTSLRPPRADGLTSRVSGFFRDVLERLGVYKYIPNFVKTPNGLRNLPDDGGYGPTTSKRPYGISTTGPSHSSSSIASLFQQFKARIKAIYPGTVWCGDGNHAKSENDIGFFYQTDNCCRAHDLCPMSIDAGGRYDRLKNNGYFTRSHCDCDKAFFNCLKNADSLVSNQIGYTYFNLLKPQCFRHEHPKVGCSKKIRGKCLTYLVDETKEKLWQWFDNLTY